MSKPKYDEGSIKVLSGLEPVRERPAMFIGSVDEDGFHHLLQEILDNSLDEAIGGHCKHIIVKVDPEEGWASVQDDGRGIPPGKHPTEGIPTIDVVFTILHAGGKFDKKNYSLSCGLHGVGASCVVALSEWLEVMVKRDGNVYFRRYEDAKPTEPDLKVKKADKPGTGTLVRFKPDPKVFKNCRFAKSRVARRLRELSFLQSGLQIDFHWIENGEDKLETFQSNEGLNDYIKYLVGKKQVLHEVVNLKANAISGCSINLAFAYDGGYDSAVHSFCNNIATTEGGVHLNAALDALCKVIAENAKDSGKLKDLDVAVTKSDVMEGLNLVVSVMVPEPQFGGQTKTRLGNSDLRAPLGDWLIEQIAYALKNNKQAGSVIVTKVAEAIVARDAARKARNLARKKSSITNTNLLGKLADCACHDPVLSELYLVEGDSAGGNGKDARDREFQAVLPLRGKVLNVTKTSLNKAMENKEIATLIQAVGVNVTDREVDLQDLRYHKIILCADADVDGGHICCLLLTFFHTFAKKLIEEGHIYVCDLPLYSVRCQGQSFYLKDDQALADFRKAHQGKKIEVSRFKGLGEMNADELAETAFNVSTRNLKQIFIGDDVEAAQMLNRLMGSDIEGRKEFLAEKLNFNEVG